MPIPNFKQQEKSLMKKISSSLSFFWICNFFLFALACFFWFFFNDLVSSLIFLVTSPLYSLYSIYSFPIQFIIFNLEDKKVSFKHWGTSSLKEYDATEIYFSYQKEIVTRVGSTCMRLRIYDSVGNEIALLSSELAIWSDKEIESVVRYLKKIGS